MALMLAYGACVWALRPFDPVPAIMMGGIHVRDVGGAAELALALLSACGFLCALVAKGGGLTTPALGWAVVALYAAALLAICSMRDPRGLTAKASLLLSFSMRRARTYASAVRSLCRRASSFSCSSRMNALWPM